MEAIRRNALGIVPLVLSLAGMVVGVAACGDPDPCSGISCSGVGTCYLDGRGTYCSCPPATYYPDSRPDCNEVNSSNPCDGVSCLGHGTCRVAEGGLTTCDCDPGYHPSEGDSRNCVLGEWDGPHPDDGGDAEVAAETGDDAVVDESAVEDTGEPDDGTAETAPVCGDGVREGTEECDGDGTEDCGLCGDNGTRTCSGDCRWSACTPKSTRCNAADESYECGTECTSRCNTSNCYYDACLCDRPGVSVSCLTMNGCAGTRSCTGSCSWSTCTATAPACTDISGLTICDGREGTTDWNCPINCRRCTCSGGVLHSACGVCTFDCPS